MSYISDWEHSKQTEEDYQEYKRESAKENARDRREKEGEDG